MGEVHDKGDGPAPEEIFTASRVDDQHIAIKSGYGKYLGVNKEGVVSGTADAIGERKTTSGSKTKCQIAFYVCSRSVGIRMLR